MAQQVQAFPPRRVFNGPIHIPALVQHSATYARFLSCINRLLTGRASLQVGNTLLFQSGAHASVPASPADIRAALTNPDGDHQVYHVYNPADQAIAAWYLIGPDSNSLRDVGFIECARMPGAPVAGGAVIPATHMVHPDMVGPFAVAADDAAVPEVHGFVIPYCPVSLAPPTPDVAFLYQACGLRTFHVQARVGGVHHWVTAETFGNLTTDLGNIAFEQHGQLCVNLVDQDGQIICRLVRDLML